MFDINDWANLKVWSEYIIPFVVMCGAVLFVGINYIAIKIKKWRDK